MKAIILQKREENYYFCIESNHYYVEGILRTPSIWLDVMVWRYSWKSAREKQLLKCISRRGNLLNVERQSLAAFFPRCCSQKRLIWNKTPPGYQADIFFLLFSFGPLLPFRMFRMFNFDVEYKLLFAVNAIPESNLLQRLLSNRTRCSLRHFPHNFCTPFLLNTKANRFTQF